MTNLLFPYQHRGTFVAHIQICIDFNLYTTVTEWCLRDDGDYINSLQSRLDNIRGRFGIGISGSSSDTCDQWFPNGLFMIFTTNLLDIFITLEPDVTD